MVATMKNTHKHLRIFDPGTRGFFCPMVVIFWFRFFSIATEGAWLSSNVADLLINLGDNNSPNRFVTKLLSDAKGDNMGQVLFTSLCLPMDAKCPTWSNDEAKLLQLKQFADYQNQKSNKIMLLVGSMSQTFTFNQVLEWIEKNTESGWSFIIVQKMELTYARDLASDELMTKYVKTPNNVVFHLENMEYEDCLRFVQFSVTNGGAGSIYASFAAGVPQAVAFSNPFSSMQGNDKCVNCKLLQELGVGPATTKSSTAYNRKKPKMILNFSEFMEQVKQNLPKYLEEALKCQAVCKQEFQEFDKRCDLTFDYLRSLEGQTHCAKTKMFPTF
jgi:hypothetical protein